MEKEIIQEVLTRQQRMQRRRLYKVNKLKIQRGRERAKKKRASSDVVDRRSRKRARNVVFKKMSGGKSKKDMSLAQRAKVEKRMEKKKKTVDRVARKVKRIVRADDRKKK